MSLEKINSINSIMIAILRVAYLNLLWIVTVVIGLGTFTFGPAMYAMLKYYDQWLRCKRELPVAKTFFKYVKENFKQTFIIGIIFEISLVIVIVNLFSLKNWYLQVANVIALILILCTMTHTFFLTSVMNYSSIKDNCIAGFLLGIGYPQYTIICWTAIIGLYWIVSKWNPAMVFLFGIGFTGLILSTTNRLVGRKVQQITGN